MAQRRIDTFASRDARNDINDNFTELYNSLTGEIDIARLPKKSIDATYIKDKSLSTDVVDFLTHGKNMFSGTFTDNLTLQTAHPDFPNGNLGYTTSSGRKSGVIKINKGDTITVTKYEGGDRFNVMLVDKYPDREDLPLPLLYLHQGDFGPEKQSHTFTNDVNAEYLVVQTNLNASSVPEMQVELGSEETEYEEYKVVFKGDLKMEDVKPSDTTFFVTKNIFDGVFVPKLTYQTGISGFPNGNIGSTSNALRKCGIIPIEPNRKYKITKRGGDRFNVMLVGDKPTTDNLPMGLLYKYQGAFGGELATHEFENTYGAKYLVVQTNFATEDIATLHVEDTSNEGYYIPKDYIDPALKQVDAKKDAVFNFYTNINQLYRHYGTLEDFWESPTTLTVEDYHDRFNDLISGHTDIASRTKLGDVTGDFPLYKYEIKPPNYEAGFEADNGTGGGYEVKLPKVYFVTGIHGYERSTSLSAYYAFKEILENQTNSELLEFLKMNVHINIIALANPSGWTNDTYGNGNNINLNRQFPPNQEPTQSEAILIKEEIERNLDMDFFIDFHNINSNLRKTWLGFSLTNNDMFIKTLSNMYRNLGREWQKEHSTFPQELTKRWAYNAQSNNGTVAHFTEIIHGIPSTLMEIPNEIEWVDGGKFGEPTVRLGVEYIINSLIGALRTKM